MADLEPEFVTVLIGVNDVVQGVPLERTRPTSSTILDALLARLPADRIVTVAIPDYTVTPAGADYGDPAGSTTGSCATTRSWSGSPAERGIAYVDIFDISLRAADDRSLVADDGLHPSGAQYAALGRADRAGRGAAARALTAPSSAPVARRSSCSRASLIPKWWAISW